MSQTLNNITMLAALGEITKNETHLQDYVSKTASYLAQQGKPFREVPELFTETLIAERLDILRESRGGQEYAHKVMATDISADLEEAGIERNDLSRTEVRELQVTKVFCENFHAERPHAFQSSLKNARENLYGHLQGQRDAEGQPMEGRRLPPTVLYSMAFGEGRGVGLREPDADQLIADMLGNDRIQSTMDKLMEAHNAFYDAQGLEGKAKEVIRSLTEQVREGVARVTRNPVKALGSVFVISAAASMGMVVGEKMDGPDVSKFHYDVSSHSYSLSASSFPPNDRAYTVNMHVNHGQTASEMASDVLKAVGVPSSTHNIHAMLEASNIQNPNQIYANTIVDLKLPVTGTLSDWQASELNKVADSINFSGKQIMTAHLRDPDGTSKDSFLNHLNAKKGSDLSM